MTHRFKPILIALLCVAPLTAMAADAPGATPPQPFNATYKVLRKGSPLGTSTLSLRHNADGTWTYQSRLKAQSGLAALLGGSLEETSRFRWHDGRIESLDYDYELRSSIKNKQRRVHVDWEADTVKVETGSDGDFSYKPQPGLVERHLLMLALGRAVVDGQTAIDLPVAVKNRVQKQTFAVRGHDTVKVPAGSIDSVRVVRTHDDKGYTAWFAPKRFGAIPVKVSQDGGGDITMLLESVQKQP